MVRPALRTAVTAERGFEWRVIREIMTRPQPVTLPMVTLFALIPFYLVIGNLVAGGPVHIPELGLDRAIPASGAWALVYASLFLAAILPAFVVHQQRHLHLTICAYLMAWLIAFACFLAYPTMMALRPPIQSLGDGFFDWSLRVIYSSDARYNCLPSLHVAQCFIAASACYGVHRGVGLLTFVWATLVAFSTLFTKQHYVLDVVTGVALAYAAWFVFLRGFPRAAIPERERRYAPYLAAGAFAAYGLIAAVFGGLYLLGVQP